MFNVIDHIKKEIKRGGSVEIDPLIKQFCGDIERANRGVIKSIEPCNDIFSRRGEPYFSFVCDLEEDVYQLHECIEIFNDKDGIRAEIYICDCDIIGTSKIELKKFKHKKGDENTRTELLDWITRYNIELFYLVEKGGALELLKLFGQTYTIEELQQRIENDTSSEARQAFAKEVLRTKILRKELAARAEAVAQTLDKAYDDIDALYAMFMKTVRENSSK